MSEKKEKLLLHVCCASCSPYVIKTLSVDFTPTIYFYNPNIHPFEEYERRRLDVEGFVRSLGYDFIEGEYDTQRWRYITTGLEDEPEGGSRCEICFHIRMNHVARYAVKNGYKWFATTLTVSPHKNSRTINRISRQLAKDYGINFLDIDFKKRNGFKISMQLAKEMGFYRQNYCGCLSSLKETRERQRGREELEQQSHQVLSPFNL